MFLFKIKPMAGICNYKIFLSAFMYFSDWHFFKAKISFSESCRLLTVSESCNLLTVSELAHEILMSVVAYYMYQWTIYLLVRCTYMSPMRFLNFDECSVKSKVDRLIIVHVSCITQVEKYTNATQFYSIYCHN